MTERILKTVYAHLDFVNRLLPLVDYATIVHELLDGNFRSAFLCQRAGDTRVKFLGAKRHVDEVGFERAPQSINASKHEKLAVLLSPVFCHYESAPRKVLMQQCRYREMYTSL